MLAKTDSSVRRFESWKSEFVLASPAEHFDRSPLNSSFILSCSCAPLVHVTLARIDVVVLLTAFVIAVLYPSKKCSRKEMYRWLKSSLECWHCTGTLEQN